MKILFCRSLTTLMCIGALITGTQSWAENAKQSTAANAEIKANTKAQGKCTKPCSTNNDEKGQQDQMQHEHGNMADMSQMDHSKMGEMNHSKMMNMSNK
ncbi:hypothetical protein MER72_18815 [Acinetobacter baumannii]|nr:hypothetical protein [Acinetobacter baumannii]